MTSVFQQASKLHGRLSRLPSARSIPGQDAGSGVFSKGSWRGQGVRVVTRQPLTGLIGFHKRIFMGFVFVSAVFEILL